MKKKVQSAKNKAENFNELNLLSLDEHIEKTATEPLEEIFTMVQVNASCEVTISESSKRKFAKALLS